jgi:hypothetical protein
MLDDALESDPVSIFDDSDDDYFPPNRNNTTLSDVSDDESGVDLDPILSNDLDQMETEQDYETVMNLVDEITQENDESEWMDSKKNDRKLS